MAVVNDLLVRFLRTIYPKVTYVSNITDIDDKIIAASEEKNIPIKELTKNFTDIYNEDMSVLGVSLPDIQPKATDHINEMIELIKLLIQNNFAYEKEGHVLFDVPKFKNYGSLSGRNRDEQIVGSRVEVAPYKKDPTDFVLWKPSPAPKPGWESPWGFGRPGWHLECSAMSEKTLGLPFDIHSGGADLIFPHHENEIAQSKCSNPHGLFAQYWVHNEMLQVEGKKMSKSLGNFFTVRDLLDEGIPGEVIRFVFLSTHYRKPMDWTKKKALEAEATLRRWHEMVQNASLAPLDDTILNCVANDLNTPGALSRMHEIAKIGSPDLLLSAGRFLGLLSFEEKWWRKKEPDSNFKIP